MIAIVSEQARQTISLARQMGESVKQGIRIALEGELGAGKTTFVQGFAKGIRVPENYYITSPTFNIINEYPAGDLTLCHLDLYRLGEADELEYIGFDDLLDDHHVILVEWPGLLDETGFAFDLRIRFSFNDQYHRVIELIPSGQSGTDLISRLSL